MCIDFIERGRKNHQCERETSIGCLPYTPWLGIEPATQVCALIDNQTHNLLVYGMALQLS